LLDSSSANGLFPGALHPVTKEPELFHDEAWRDFYWHRTFEVPYILWQFSLEKQNAEGAEPTKVPLAIPVASTQLEMKRWMPFNNLIVQKSIVVLLDEWLYPLPSFLDFTPSCEEMQKRNYTDDRLKSVIKDIPKSERIRQGKIEQDDDEVECLSNNGM
jgi:hypothetical protein